MAEITPTKTIIGRLTLSQWIVISMIVGVALGALFPTSERAIHGGWAASDLALLSNVFLQLFIGDKVSIYLLTCVASMFLRLYP